eukprot:TRINITY_DN18691_c0_g1_i1.p2 TRINITY_DN18691_c0_g1~~TRINITY_DN18691_c0_g1_i1.p2  ORF type:complete len:141 (-),score=29.21 TRINITY_DN18691_c0_g1_i1:286-708(-)
MAKGIIECMAKSRQEKSKLNPPVKPTTTATTTFELRLYGDYLAHHFLCTATTATSQSSSNNNSNSNSNSSSNDNHNNNINNNDYGKDMIQSSTWTPSAHEACVQSAHHGGEGSEGRAPFTTQKRSTGADQPRVKEQQTPE